MTPELLVQLRPPLKPARRERSRLWTGIGVLSAALAACGTTREAQLERVAKDWCETIRASQVIPVYPLTEDLQPGDVFLVQVPVDRQQEIYKSKGYLPLDNHLARLDPREYGAFYDHSFLPLGRSRTLPMDWMLPGGGNAGGWAAAPTAAFPTYTFSVNQASGFNLAIPISGVPVGLSLLGTHSANGSVAIKESRTIGVDTVSLYHQLEDWADGQRSFLASFGALPGTPVRNYLRVVTRIYTTGKLDVQLADARSISGGGDAGQSRPVDLFLPTVPDGDVSSIEAARGTYERGIAHLNNMVGAREVPTYASGDDYGLSAEELRLRAEKRGEELEKQKETAKATQAEKQTAADEARENANPAAEALRKAQEEVAAASKKMKEASSERKGAEGREQELADSGGSEEELAAAHDEVEAASQAETEARELLDEKLTVLDDASEGYNDDAEAIAQADVELFSANAALERLEGFAPGASFRFTAASARSVSLTEDFDPPLIIGYLAFDVPLIAGGGLGPPIPTHAILDPSFGIPLGGERLIARELNEGAALNALYEGISADESREARSIKSSLNNLTRFIPQAFKKVVVAGDGNYTMETEDLGLMRDGVVDFHDYTAFRQKRDRYRDKLLELQSDGDGNSSKLERDIRSYREREIENREFMQARAALLAYYAANAP